jgi:uncharacterized membrane protein YdjX (TVP38/TMEM64 family)
MTFFMSRLKRLRTLFRLQNAIAFLSLMACGLAGWWMMSYFHLNLSTPNTLIVSLNHLGVLGIVLFISLQMLAIVISPIPGTPLTIAGGAVWGPLQAGIYGIIGIFLGCMIAYFIGRTLGRSAVQVLTGKVIYFSKNRGEMYLGWLMFITHLLPVLPFDLMSYGAGISGLSLPIYATTTLLGIIPCTFFLTYLGASFKLGLPTAVLFISLFLIVLIVVPWGVKRYNWLGLKDVVRIE